MFSNSSRQGGPKPKNARASQSLPSTLEQTDGQDKGDERITAESLARHLAAEALLRDSSEERTTSVIRRYFRLTLALAGINVLVAGTTMAALWSRSGKVPEAGAKVNAPVAQPKPEIPYPTPAPAPTPVPAAVPVPSVSVPVAPVLKVTPLPAPSSKREGVAPAPRPRRSATKTQIVQKPVDDTEAVALDNVVERW
jgi:hypothetical protein